MFDVLSEVQTAGGGVKKIKDLLVVYLKERTLAQKLNKITELCVCVCVNECEGERERSVHGCQSHFLFFSVYVAEEILKAPWYDAPQFMGECVTFVGGP